MTRDDIIRMAWEAKVLPAVIGSTTGHFAYIERFAALVAAAEREACALECDARDGYRAHFGTTAAQAIRARGTTAQQGGST